MRIKDQTKSNIFPYLYRINLADDLIVRELIDEAHPLRFYAGKSLCSKIIADEVPPTCNPLSPQNKLIFATGFLTGTWAPNSGRGSIGAKSPLTFGIKESNVGGKAPTFLARNNIRGLILEHQARSWKIIKIQDGRIELLDGTKYVGLNNFELAESLLEDFGPRTSAFTIGIAGELLFANSTIASLDMQGYPSRHAARGGTGGVMGSKKIKAIIVKSNKNSLMEYSDPKLFKEKALPWFQNLKKTQKFGKHMFGTANCVVSMNKNHSLPTQNYRRGQYKDVDKISGEAVYNLIIKNGGKYGVPCSPGCAIQCSNIIKDEEGNHVTSSLEYETIGLLGSNLLNNDLIKISRMDHLCDDLGIDTIETGSCLGVMMEFGKIEWGNADHAIKMIEGIYEKHSDSMMLGLGVFELGKKLNVNRIPHVKKQALPSYEPRALKSLAVTFLTSPMGADHTAGDVVGDNPADPTGKIDLSRQRQLTTYLLDSMGICYFVGPSLELTELISILMKAKYGMAWKKDLNGWLAWAKECLVMEKKFNTAAGLAALDHLPQFMMEEKLEEADIGFDFDRSELKTYWKNFN